jgi:hypothetical protein
MLINRIAGLLLCTEIATGVTPKVHAPPVADIVCASRKNPSGSVNPFKILSSYREKNTFVAALRKLL